MRVAIIGQDNYSPWQQVYALVKRLPDPESEDIVGLDPTDIYIGSLENRVGGFVQKAAGKRNYRFSTIRWQEVAEYDLVIGMFMPKAEGRAVIRAAIRRAHDANRTWYVIHPDLYSDVADVVQALTLLWARHGCH